MTIQAPDYVSLANEEWKTQRFSQSNGKQECIPNLPELWTPSSANNRGYVANWLIEEGKLYLVSVKGSLMTGERLALSHMFGDTDPPIFAEWFSGRMSLYRGAEIETNFILLSSKFEREAEIEFQAGRVTKCQFIDRPPLAPGEERRVIDFGP